MRYRGGGVGHKSIQKVIQKFCDDRWPEELNVERDNSPVQVEDDGEEDIGAESLSSGPIDPDNDVELSEGEAESEEESEEGLEDESDEAEEEAEEADSDDDGYGDL